MILRDTNGETYFRNEAGHTIHLSENDLAELSKHFAEDPSAAYWKEQLAIRQIKLTPEQEEKVLEWLEWWDRDGFDFLSDAIGGALEYCDIDLEVPYE